MASFGDYRDYGVPAPPYHAVPRLDYGRIQGPTMQQVQELRDAYAAAVPSSGAAASLYSQRPVATAPPTPTPRDQTRSSPMNTRAKKLLNFMLEAPDGKYEVTKPTDEQLATVLPWLTDQIVTWATVNGHCSTVNEALGHIVAAGRYTGDGRFFNAAGFDCQGYDREGYNREGFNRLTGLDREGYNTRGYDQEGYNKAGYNRYSFDRDGFNVAGLDQHGNTRAEAVAKLVGGWTKEHLAVVNAKLVERQAKVDAEAATKAAEADAATAADTTNTKGAGQPPVVTTEDEAAEPVPVTSVTSTEPARIMLLDEEGSRSVFDDLIDDEDEANIPIAVG
jgi:hypothetical protein